MAKTIITAQHDRVGAWVAARTDRNEPWFNFTTLGLEKDGELVAGCVYDNYYPKGRISLHCAAEGKFWLTREFLRAVFDYPFNFLQVKAIVNPVDADNAASVRFTSHVGFKEMCRIPGGADVCDLIIFAMTKDQCRWA